MEESLTCKQSTVIAEMNRVQDLMCQLRAIVLPTVPAGSSSELARGLFDDIFRSFDDVLSNLQSFPQLQAPESADEYDGHAKKRKQTSWTVTTTVPHNDGHQWRKYGQKRINSSRFPRSYHKCAYHKDQGCLATKTVQQRHGNHDPPKFEVTYNKHHICKLASSRSHSGKNSSSKTASSSETDQYLEAAAKVCDQSENSLACSVFKELEREELLSLEPDLNVPMKDMMPYILSPSVFDGNFWGNVIDEMPGCEDGYNFDELRDFYHD